MGRWCPVDRINPAELANRLIDKVVGSHGWSLVQFRDPCDEQLRRNGLSTGTAGIGINLLFPNIAVGQRRLKVCDTGISNLCSMQIKVSQSLEFL